MATWIIVTEVTEIREIHIIVIIYTFALVLVRSSCIVIFSVYLFDCHTLKGKFCFTG